MVAREPSDKLTVFLVEMTEVQMTVALPYVPNGILVRNPT